MSGLAGIFGHPNIAQKPNGGSQLDGQSPLTMAQQFGSVAPLTLPQFSRQISFAVPADTLIAAAGNLLIGTFFVDLSVADGSQLVLTRVGWYTTAAGLVPVISTGLNNWQASASSGETEPGTILLNSGSGAVSFYIYNPTGGSLQANHGTGVWANLLVQ